METKRDEVVVILKEDYVIKKVVEVKRVSDGVMSVKPEIQGLIKNILS